MGGETISKESLRRDQEGSPVIQSTFHEAHKLIEFNGRFGVANRFGVMRSAEKIFFRRRSRTMIDCEDELIFFFSAEVNNTICEAEFC